MGVQNERGSCGIQKSADGMKHVQTNQSYIALGSIILRRIHIAHTSIPPIVKIKDSNPLQICPFQWQ